MKPFFPENIFVEEGVSMMPLTRQILSRCPGSRIVIIPEAKDLIRSFQKKRPSGYIEKKDLLLCFNRGRFLEPCPGTKKEYICCCYTILNTGTGCPLDCSYCVLQAYLNNPFITMFVNRQDMLDELEANSSLLEGRIVRVGTGEFMDSLALEHLTDFTAFILPFLRKRKGIILELKTKTINIKNIPEADHTQSLMFSWSLNSGEIIHSEETGSASLKDRISAARCLTERGYRVGFHFDPIIYYPGWEKGYKEVVDLLKENIDPSFILWISLGSLRYMPQLKIIAGKRFPGTGIYSQEFIPGLDGKMRYLQDMRIDIYTKMVSWLRDYSEKFFIYFCMENRTVWKKVLGFAPSSNAGLKKLMDERVMNKIK